MKKRLIAILFCLTVVCFTLAACGGSGGTGGSSTPPQPASPEASLPVSAPPESKPPESKPPKSTPPASVPPESAKPDPAPVESKPPEPAPTTSAPAGGSGLLASYNGIDIIVYSVKEYPGASIIEDYPDVTAVRNGYKWILVDMEMKNGTGEVIGGEQTYSWRIDIFDTDGNDNDYASVYMEKLGDEIFDLTSQIEPGQSRSGKLLFTLKSDCNTYTLRYQPYRRAVDGTIMEITLSDLPDTGSLANYVAPPSGEALDLIETSVSYKGIEITVNSVKEYPGASIIEDYPDVTAVRNGYKWVLVDMEMKNGTGEAIGGEQTYSWWIDIFDEDGNDNGYASVYMEKLGDERFDLTSQIEPGQSRSGKLLFTVKAEFNTYTLRYQPYRRAVDGTIMEITLR